MVVCSLWALTSPVLLRVLLWVVAARLLEDVDGDLWHYVDIASLIFQTLS